MKRTPIAALALILLASIPMQAGETAASSGKTVEPPAPEKKDWSATLRIDGWMLQANVGVSNPIAGMNKNVFLGLGDILSHVDWLIPIGAEFCYKNFGLMSDFVGTKLSGSGANPAASITTARVPLYSGAQVDMTLAVLNLVGFYRVMEKETFSINILGGARYLYVDMDVTLSGGAVGRLRGPLLNNTHKEAWDGVGGVRYLQNFGDKFFLSFYGDVGAGTSKLTWQVWSGLGYRLSKHVSVTAGYRYMTSDAGKRATDIGVTTSGPSLDLHWEF